MELYFVLCALALLNTACSSVVPRPGKSAVKDKSCIKMSPEKEAEINTITEEITACLNKIASKHDNIDITVLSISIESHSDDESEEKDVKLHIEVNDCPEDDDESSDVTDEVSYNDPDERIDSNENGKQKEMNYENPEIEVNIPAGKWLCRNVMTTQDWTNSSAILKDISDSIVNQNTSTKSTKENLVSNPIVLDEKQITNSVVEELNIIKTQDNKQESKENRNSNNNPQRNTRDLAVIQSSDKLLDNSNNNFEKINKTNKELNDNRSNKESVIILNDAIKDNRNTEEDKYNAVKEEHNNISNNIKDPVIFNGNPDKDAIEKFINEHVYLVNDEDIDISQMGRNNGDEALKDQEGDFFVNNFVFFVKMNKNNNLFK